MDALSACFLNLERSVAQHKQMVCLRLPDGRVSTDVTDMRKHVDFYSALYTAELCDSDFVAWLLQVLPRLDSASSTELDSHLTLQDLLWLDSNTGWSPGFDGLPSDFYKHFWACIGAGLRSRLVAAGYTKLGHLLTSGSAAMSERTGIRPGHLLDQVQISEVQISLPADYLSFLNDPSVIAQWREGCQYDFPELTVSPAVERTEDERHLLSFPTPVLVTFSLIGRKALYLVRVKVSQARLLDGVLSTRLSELFGADSSPKGCWRVLYKCPIDKRTADLQWTIVHGAIATNRHRVHLDPSVGEGCHFCPRTVTLFHLFVQCVRLGGLLTEWFSSLGEAFSFHLFIFGPKYRVRRKNVFVLLNFLSGTAKLAIWKTRKNQMLGQGAVDVVAVFLGLVAARRRLEHAYYNLVGKLPEFMSILGINEVLCTVDDVGNLRLMF
ncbi:hypothetical protein AOLI_G00054520 [Acnodon oligacanthus]